MCWALGSQEGCSTIAWEPGEYIVEITRTDQSQFRSGLPLLCSPSFPHNLFSASAHSPKGCCTTAPISESRHQHHGLMADKLKMGLKQWVWLSVNLSSAGFAALPLIYPGLRWNEDYIPWCKDPVQARTGLKLEWLYCNLSKVQIFQTWQLLSFTQLERTRLCHIWVTTYQRPSQICEQQPSWMPVAVGQQAPVMFRAAQARNLKISAKNQETWSLYILRPRYSHSHKHGRGTHLTSGRFHLEDLSHKQKFRS